MAATWIDGDILVALKDEKLGYVVYLFRRNRIYLGENLLFGFCENVFKNVFDDITIPYMGSHSDILVDLLVFSSFLVCTACVISLWFGVYGEVILLCEVNYRVID